MVPWQTEQSLLTAFSFIAFCLVSVPLYWHIEGDLSYDEAKVLSKSYATCRSLERGMYPLYRMGGNVYPRSVHQLRCMEEQCYQLGPRLVRHWYVDFHT